jgi:hypothetical protein
LVAVDVQRAVAIYWNGRRRGTVPEAVKEAYRRLANYMGEAPVGDDIPGATNFRLILAQREIEMEWQRAQSWLSRAMSNSGAGDLLRPYRRAQ